MRLYQFNLTTIEWGGGIVVVAANNAKEAYKVAKGSAKAAIHGVSWPDEKDITVLEGKWIGDTPRILTEYIQQE